MDPLVTVGIPFLNPGPWLAQAVRSIFAQTFQDWELILVNDGSTDESLEMANKIRDLRVRIVNDGKSLGLPQRLNQIVELARGKYIARMDADDLAHPERLEKQVAFLERELKYDAVFTGVYLLDVQGNILGVRRGYDPTIVEILGRGGYVHPTMMARTEWFRKHLYAVEYPRAEDRELFARAILNGTRFAVMSEPLYFYRWYGNMKPKAMLQGYKSERLVLTKYGPQLLGKVASTVLIGRSYLKSAAVSLLSGVLGERGLAKLYQRKEFPVISEEALSVKNILYKISLMHVPGW